MRKSGGIVTGLVCLIIAMCLAGCQVPNHGGYNYNDGLDPYGGGAVTSTPETGLRVGDRVVITFADAPTDMPPHEEKIKEDGTLTLPLIGSIVATNKTAGQLQREIHQQYVPKIFKRLTVTVRTGDLFFTVSGEVREPSRQAWINKITLVQAIASARGFTDFANEKKVQIIRANGRSETVNYREVLRNPTLDVDIHPGDRIIVPRRWL